jgi:hypothetical protein
MSLSRLEVILTQLCLLTHKETDLVSQAMRYLPRILEVVDLEPTTIEEIYNLILELQTWGLPEPLFSHGFRRRGFVRNYTHPQIWPAVISRLAVI